MNLWFAVAVLLAPFAALAEEWPLSPLIESVTAGVFCPEDYMDKVEAPGTELGYILTPSSDPEITWLTTEVPARLGIAFGVQLTQIDGPPLGQLDVEVRRPSQAGGTLVDRWTAWSDASGPTTNFWVFNHPSEIAEGDWQFRISKGDVMLAHVTFVVKDAAKLSRPVPDCSLTIS